MARRREYLYLGALISSALSVMATMRFASFFVGGSASIFQLEVSRVVGNQSDDTVDM